VIAAIEARSSTPIDICSERFAGVWEDQLNLADPAAIAKTGRRIRASRAKTIGAAIGVGGDQRGL